METCASCGREYPAVAGAPTQVCPHCGHEQSLRDLAASTSTTVHADPVGAVQQAWRIARSDYARLLLIWLPALAFDLVLAFATNAFESAQSLPSDPSLMTTGEQMRWLGVVLPLSLASSALRLALWAFVAAFTLDRALGGKRLAQWRGMVGVALGAGVVLTFAYVAGALLLLVGFFVVLHWFLYVPAYLAHGTRGVGAAFEASRRFARERRTYGFTALVVLVGGVALAAEFAAGLAPGALGLAGSAVAAWLLGPVVPLLAASYVAVAHGAVRPADGAAPASGARSTTTCPRCGTLIAYTPSAIGSSTDVVCPSCGYAGRVL